jgi:hypothetical protein
MLNASLRNRVRRLEQTAMAPLCFGFVLYPPDWPDASHAMSLDQVDVARDRIALLAGSGHRVYVCNFAGSADRASAKGAGIAGLDEASDGYPPVSPAPRPRSAS